MTRYERPFIETQVVFAAACAAHRVNGDYIKTTVSKYDDEGNFIEIETLANKFLMQEFIDGKHEILDEDRALANKIITYCRGISMKILTGASISEFEMAVLKIVDKPETNSKYDLAVIACLPASYARYLIRHEQNMKLTAAAGCIDGAIGSKVELVVEVIRCNYSKAWNIFYVTGITNGRTVFFSQKNEVATGKTISIKGTIKEHKEDRTQLTRVKVK